MAVSVKSTVGVSSSWSAYSASSSSSSWAELTASTASAIRIVGMTWVGGNGFTGSVDIGYGGAGSEVSLLSEPDISRQYGTFLTVLPIPIAVAAGTRLAVRIGQSSAMTVTVHYVTEASVR